MVNFKKVIFFILFLNASTVLSYVDLNLSYTLSKRSIDGTDDSINSDVGRAETSSSGYSVNWAWYIWDYTALELNYAQTEERLKDNRGAVSSDGQTTILNVDSSVTTEIAGVGLRQSFANRKASIVPSLSVGYAQFTTSGETSYVVEEGGVEKSIDIEQDKRVFSSGYIALMLRFRLTELMGLTVSAKTVMPEFDTTQAQNNVTYAAGFSWIF